MSRPITDTIRPSTPLIHPFIGLACAVIVPQIRIPNTERRKNSHDANFSARLVKRGVNVRTKITLIKVPRKLEPVARNIARPPFPCFAIGYPSKAVAAEAGVPGIFNRIADWHPPEIAPT